LHASDLNEEEIGLQIVDNINEINDAGRDVTELFQDGFDVDGLED